MAQFPPALQFSGSITAPVVSPQLDTQGYSSVYVLLFSNASCTADIDWYLSNGADFPVLIYTDTNTGVGTFVMQHQIRSRYFRFTVTPSVNPQTLRYGIYLVP